MGFPYTFPFNFAVEYFKRLLEILTIDISEHPIQVLNIPAERPIQPLDLYEPEEAITEVLYI